MDVAVLCDICGKTGFSYTCSLCGKRVCNRCITVGGVCKVCAGGKNIRSDEIVLDKVLGDKGIGPVS